eukprot:10923744-Heterocapsa_arctica.AAC.1
MRSHRERAGGVGTGRTVLARRGLRRARDRGHADPWLLAAAASRCEPVCPSGNVQAPADTADSGLRALSRVARARVRISSTAQRMNSSKIRALPLPARARNREFARPAGGERGGR